MLDFPGPPPVPGRDVDWTEFPNSFDIKYMEWREAVEEFSLQLRAQFRNMMAAQPIPMSKYKDGDHKFVWDGKAYPVSKSMYTWMNKTSLHKNDRAVMLLKETLIERARQAQKKS